MVNTWELSGTLSVPWHQSDATLNYSIILEPLKFVNYIHLFIHLAFIQCLFGARTCLGFWKNKDDLVSQATCGEGRVFFLFKFPVSHG